MRAAAAVLPRPSRRPVVVPAVLWLLSALLGASAAASARAQTLRIANWNVTEYRTDVTPSILSARRAAFQTALYGTFQGRSMAPDIFIGQEFGGANSVNNFLDMLNTAPDSPGDWVAAPFLNDPNTTTMDNALFYRGGKVSLVNQGFLPALSGESNTPPRQTYRHTVRLLGAPSTPTLTIYNAHMKSGSGSDDQARRLTEARRITAHAGALPAGSLFLVAGDFNMQSSTQAAFRELTGQTFNTGLFRDPISTPGEWNNDDAFRYVHTQDQVNGMDDRLDFMLLSSALVDGQGVDYIGAYGTPYSTTTWNDPNHSYRVWGNDGWRGQTTALDRPIRTTGNEMVGQAIAQTIINSVGSNNGSAGGHMPMFLDLRLSSSALPEPSALGLVAPVLGVAAFGGVARRRRRVTPPRR